MLSKMVRLGSHLGARKQQDSNPVILPLFSALIDHLAPWSGISIALKAAETAKKADENLVFQCTTCKYVIFVCGPQFLQFFTLTDILSL